MTREIVATGKLFGTVLAVQANFYRVQMDESLIGSDPLILLCTRRSRLKKIGQQVMVGDRVIVEEPDWIGGRGAVAEVLP
ncbi:MAG: ribosome small subunit-dependent GTPase, partial [Dolichospermum sp.]